MGVHSAFMADGAREPQGSPFLWTVCQPRVVRHLHDVTDFLPAVGGHMRPRKSNNRSEHFKRIDRIDELDAKLTSLLHEARFIADLIEAGPDELREVDACGLAVILNRMADALLAARDNIQGMMPAKES